MELIAQLKKSVRSSDTINSNYCYSITVMTNPHFNIHIFIFYEFCLEQSYSLKNYQILIWEYLLPINDTDYSQSDTGLEYTTCQRLNKPIQTAKK